MNKAKPTCDCGNRPTWIYMPGYSNDNDWSCDDCVPRGCSCNHSDPLDGNWDNREPSNWEVLRDEQGREWPCCEHEGIPEEDWNENGELKWMLDE